MFSRQESHSNANNNMIKVEDNKQQNTPKINALFILPALFNKKCNQKTIFLGKKNYTKNNQHPPL